MVVINIILREMVRVTAQTIYFFSSGNARCALFVDKITRED